MRVLARSLLTAVPSIRFRRTIYNPLPLWAHTPLSDCRRNADLSFEDTVKLMVSNEYLRMEEVPGIPSSAQGARLHFVRSPGRG